MLVLRRRRRGEHAPGETDSRKFRHLAAYDVGGWRSKHPRRKMKKGGKGKKKKK
jgi:hypothetical protein